jgi:hypothetical protein
LFSISSLRLCGLPRLLCCLLRVDPSFLPSLLRYVLRLTFVPPINFSRCSKSLRNFGMGFDFSGLILDLGRMENSVRAFRIKKGNGNALCKTGRATTLFLHVNRLHPQHLPIPFFVMVPMNQHYFFLDYSSDSFDVVSR